MINSLRIGAVGGFALAPAGLTSASAGVAAELGVTAGTSLTAAGVPALAGQIGGSLIGAQFGSAIGGQLADENFAGAIQTGAQAGLRVLDDLLRFCRSRHVRGQVTFTGGNPLLYPHVFELYSAASERGFYLAVLGNPAPREQIEKLIALAGSQNYRRETSLGHGTSYWHLPTTPPSAANSCSPKISPTPQRIFQSNHSIRSRT